MFCMCCMFCMFLLPLLWCWWWSVYLESTGRDKAVSTGCLCPCPHTTLLFLWKHILFCVFCPNFLTKRLKTGRLSITNGSFPSKTLQFQIRNFWKQRSIVFVLTAKMQLPDNWLTSPSLQSPVVYRGCHWSMYMCNRQQKGPKKSLGTQNIFRLPFVISWCGCRSIH